MDADTGAQVVRLLGGPYVTAGSRRQEVPEGSKQLLAFVALRRRRVDRRHAAGTLWSGVDEERAAGNLRSALWRLRRTGIDVLLADKWSLALRPDVLVDVHLMDQWASAGRFADAVEAAIVAIGAEPLRESAQRVLIEAHVAEGNLSEARRIWREYRDLVHRELGVDPSLPVPQGYARA